MATRIETTARNPAPVRRFTLLDAMILVAATAVGCAVDGWIVSVLGPRGSDLLAILRTTIADAKYLDLVWIAATLAWPIAAAWTLALIPLRLFRPRPSLRRLASQPGWVACCGFGIAVGFVTPLVVGLVASRSVWAGNLEDFLLTVPLYFAPAVLSAWLTLILGRRWRAEPSWIDRLGRALGVAWIALAAVCMIMIGVGSA